MRLIKRYANRKLYDTTTKTYVTLEAVGVMVSRGEEIQVLDNDSNQDLTSVVLSQLLLERERAQRFLPSAVLSQLWRAGNQTLTNLARPFVPDTLRQFLEQEIEAAFGSWLDLAEGGEEEVLRLLENLIERRKQSHRSPISPFKAEAETKRAQASTNPLETVGGELARRLGLRRNLDNFEDWSADPAPQLPLESKPPTYVATLLEELAQTLAQLEKLDATTLTSVNPQLARLQQKFTRLVGLNENRAE